MDVAKPDACATSIRFPNDQVPNPADATAGLPRAPDRSLLGSAYRLFPTHIGLEKAGRARNWDVLLDPPGTAPAGFETPQVTSRNLEASRMAVLRQGPWQVFFHYGQLNASHAQREALNFEAFHGSTDVTHDPGTVGYGSPLHREFYTQGAAHNVPLVNGQGQEGWDRGELVAFDIGKGLVRARQPKYRRDAIAERELRFEGERLYDTVWLTLKTNVPARLGLALHLQGNVVLPLGFSAHPEFNGSPSFAHWTNPRSATMRDQARFVIRLKGKALRLTLNLEGEFRAVHATTPDVPPARRESLYFECLGTSAVFRAQFE